MKNRLMPTLLIATGLLMGSAYAGDEKPKPADDATMESAPADKKQDAQPAAPAPAPAEAPAEKKADDADKDGDGSN